jgi:hypothetical protein
MKQYRMTMSMQFVSEEGGADDSRSQADCLLQAELAEGLSYILL